MRGSVPLVLALVVAVAVGAGMNELFDSRGLSIGLAVVLFFVVQGEAKEYLGIVDPNARPVTADTPLLARPAVRRRLFMLFVLMGATSLILREIVVGDFDTEAARDWADGLGIWGPLILILVLAGAMVFAPLPNPPIMIAAGLLWGTFLGVVYSVIGQLLGAAIIFFISRRFGRRFIPRLVGKRAAERVDRLAKEMGPQLVFWWRMMPISFDFAAYAAGLTGMSFRLFIVLVFFGSLLPTTMIVWFGDVLDASWTVRIAWFVIVLVSLAVPVTILYYRNRERIPPIRDLLRSLAGEEREPSRAD